MPQRDSYEAGTPSWIDLQTTDLDGAKAFYGGTFDWTFEDQPMPDGNGVYSMATFKDGLVGGLSLQGPMLAEMGAPPAWNTYLAVDDLDAVLAKVPAAGGQILMPATDIGEAGRMSFVMDPSGAAVGLWQANLHIGATIVNEPNTWIWNELVTDKADAAAPFFATILGLTTSEVEMGGNPYTLFNVGETQVAGMVPPQMEGVPNHWHVYLATENVDQTVATAKGLGGLAIVEPFETPVGKMAVLRDPQGAVFTVMAPPPSA